MFMASYNVFDLLVHQWYTHNSHLQTAMHPYLSIHIELLGSNKTIARKTYIKVNCKYIYLHTVHFRAHMYWSNDLFNMGKATDRNKAQSIIYLAPFGFVSASFVIYQMIFTMDFYTCMFSGQSLKRIQNCKETRYRYTCIRTFHEHIKANP